MRNFFLALLILFSGCNIIKKTNASPTFEKISTKRILENVEKNRSEFTYLLLRSQVSVVENDSKNQFNISLRIKNENKILISGSLLIPLFKGLFTKDKLMFYEKLNKSYYKGDYSYISKLLNFEFNLQSIQDLLTGQPLIFRESRLNQSLNNVQYVLKSYDRKLKVSNEYSFDPETTLVMLFILCTVSLGFILSGLYPRKKSLLIFNPDAFSNTGKHSSSVAPG